MDRIHNIMIFFHFRLLRGKKHDALIVKKAGKMFCDVNDTEKLRDKLPACGNQSGKSRTGQLAVYRDGCNNVETPFT